MTYSFFLISETSFHASYLVTKWIEHFGRIAEFKGIAVRENPLPDNVREHRERFHQEFAGQRELAEADWKQLQLLYPTLSDTEKAMIRLFGVSVHSATYHPGTVFLGSNLNSSCAQDWLVEICQASNKPFLFIFLDQLLASWWIELTGSRIINGHSAVLPYARGMFAIENRAMMQDIRGFEQSAGATVHYIDTGIDTGPIIRVEGIQEPLRFNSLWELKGYTFMTLFRLMTQVVMDMLKEQENAPIGMHANPLLRGPNFNSRDFTLEARERAQAGYLRMKARAMSFLRSSS